VGFKFSGGKFFFASPSDLVLSYCCISSSLYTMKVIQALVLGVASSTTTAGNPLIKLSPPSLTTNEPNHNDEGFNPVNIYFEYLNQCSEAELNKDSCLVSKTIQFFSEMDGPPSSMGDDDDGEILLAPEESGEGEDNDCDTPDVSEQDLRYIMDSVRLECGSVPDQEFESAVAGFTTLFSNVECNAKLCDDESLPSDPLFIEIMFEEASACAGVEPDMPVCLRDHILGLLFSEPPDMDWDDDGTTHEHSLQRKLQNSCETPSESEFVFFLSMMLDETEAQSACALEGVSITSDDIYKATTDIAQVFASPHCLLDEGGCTDDYSSFDDDYQVCPLCYRFTLFVVVPHVLTEVISSLSLTQHQFDDDDSMMLDAGGLNGMNIAISYIEQCADLELNRDTCLYESTIHSLMSMDMSPSQPNSHHRFLQMASGDDVDQCQAPELPNELFVRSIVDGAKDDCMNKGLVISDQEVDDTVADFVSLFGAQDCWIQLCEEGSNGNGPSEFMIQIMIEEIASCAGADLESIDPCLFDQMMNLLFSPGDNDDGFGGDSLDRVRRRLQDTFDNTHTNNNDDLALEPSPCVEEPNDAEIYFVVSLLMAGAEEQCLELGETLHPGATSLASAELFKLFSAQHCWGVPADNGCEHDNKNHEDGAHSTYLDFLKEETTWMLGQCADVEEMSCVFSRSIEVIHGMHQHHHTTMNNDIHQLAQHEISHMCAAPVDHEFDIYQIATHAKEHCFHVGAFVHSDHYQQAVDDIHKLMTMPECWEDLCHPESKDAILDEWMHSCAMMDIKFHDESLDRDMLKCMTEYIVPSIEEGDNWACSLSHDHQSCNRMALKDAYIHCGGEVATPSPTPLMQLSMSFAYTENDYDWAIYEPEMSFSYTFEDDFSMPYGDDDWQVVPPPSPPHHHEDEEMNLYIDEVCHLISNLSSETAQYCLEPVCDGLWLDDAVVNDNNHHENDDAWKYSVSPTPQPSSVEFVPVKTSSPTSVPTSMPITAKPSAKPTPKPTNQPSPSPTALVFGEIEVAFEVEVKLEGLNMTDIDITKLDEVVDILESVFGDLLPEGAIVRILSVGGLSVARRLFRWLQSDDSASSGGVEVQFEIILTEQCASLKCDEADTLSEELYQTVTNDFSGKVESGALTESIQTKAAEKGVESLENVSISSVKTGQPTVTVKEAKDQTLPTDPDDDDDSSSHVLATMASLAIVLVSALIV